jgi:hypothetical protein
MSTQLRNQINDLAIKFASQLMSALQTASLSELANEAASQGSRRGPGRPAKGGIGAGPLSAPGRGGKRRRRSAADIGETVDAIVKLLKTNRAGLRAEQIRTKLGLARKEIPRPIAAALATRKITKKGQKRATTYFAR